MRVPRLLVPRAAFNVAFLPFLFAPQRLQLFTAGRAAAKAPFWPPAARWTPWQGAIPWWPGKWPGRCLPAALRGEQSHPPPGAGRLFRANKSGPCLTCTRNGAQVLFIGLQDVEKVKSISPARGALTDIWVEEATECSLSDIKQLGKAPAGAKPPSQAPHPVL